MAPIPRLHQNPGRQPLSGSAGEKTSHSGDIMRWHDLSLHSNFQTVSLRNPCNVNHDPSTQIARCKLLHDPSSTSRHAYAARAVREAANLIFRLNYAVTRDLQGFATDRAAAWAG